MPKDHRHPILFLGFVSIRWYYVYDIRSFRILCWATLFWNATSLRCSFFFISNHVTHMSPVNVLFAKCYILTILIFQPFVGNIFLWNSEMSHFRHPICFLGSIVNKIWVYEIFKWLLSLYSLSSFLYHISHILFPTS